MSLPFHLIRAAHLNRNTMHLTALFNQFNIQQSEEVKPTARKAKIIGEFSQSDLSVNDSPHFLSFKSKYVTPKYTKEPYPDLRCWIIFDHLNSYIQDLSLNANHARYVNGYPCLTIGEDSGVYSRNLATIMNREDEILEYYTIPHNSTIDFADTAFSTGWTQLFIFKPYSFTRHENQDATIFHKVNVSTGTGGASLRIGSTGRLKYFVRDASTNYNCISEEYKTRLIAYNTVVVTYDPLASPRIRMRINGEVMTDDADETPDWGTQPIDRDAYFAIGVDHASGKSHVALQEYRLYKGALTDTQCKNLFKNKLTMESYEYGQGFFLGYARYPPASTNVNFDSTTFDSTTYYTS